MRLLILIYTKKSHHIMKYLKTRHQFVFEKKNFDRVEISKNYGSSAIVKEALNNDITWGGSLLGRLFSSIGRKLRIEYNKFKVNGLVQQLQDELLNLCAEYKKDVIEDDDDYGPVMFTYLLQQIDDEVNDTSRNDDKSRERLIDKGMLSDTISWIENEIDESVLPKKGEVIKRLENFKRRLEKLSGSPDPDAQDFLDKSAKLLKAFQSLLSARYTVKLVGGPSGGSGGGSNGPQKDEEFYVKDNNHNLYAQKVKITKVLGGNKFEVQPLVGTAPQNPSTLDLSQLLKVDSEKGKAFAQFLTGNSNASIQDKKRKMSDILADTSLKESYFDFGSYILINEAGTNPPKELNYAQDKETYNIWKKISSSIKKDESDETIKNKINKIKGYVNNVDANKKTIKLIGGLMASWYKKNKDKNDIVPPHVDLIKDEYANTVSTRFGEVDREDMSLVKYMSSMAKFIMKIDFDPGGGQKIDFGDKMTKLLRVIKSLILQLNKIWDKLGSDDERKDIINEKLYNKIFEYADADGKIKKLWDEEIGNNKDEYIIDESKLKAFKERNEKRVEEETTIGLDRDRLVRIVRIFGEAHRLYCWDYIPSNRPGMVVSGMTLREYRKVGKGESSTNANERGGGISPGYGPWINLKIYESWERGVMDMVERPDVKKLLSSMMVKNEVGGKSKGDRFEDDETKTKSYEKTTLFSFIMEMITISDSPDYYRERRKVISKHFLGDLKLSDIGDRELTPPQPDIENEEDPKPEDTNKCSWFKPDLIDPSLPKAGTWMSHIRNWKDKFFYWSVIETASKTEKHIHGYILGEIGDYIVIRFEMDGEQKKLGPFIRNNVDSKYTFVKNFVNGNGGSNYYGIFRRTQKINFEASSDVLEVSYTDKDLSDQKKTFKFRLKQNGMFVLSALPSGAKKGDKQKAVPIKSGIQFKRIEDVINKLK